MTHQMSHAGQVGRTDRETIFGLRGQVRSMIEVKSSAFLLPAHLLEKSILAFRPDGNRIDSITYDRHDHIVSKTVFTYDENGRRTGPRVYKGNETALDYWIRFTYDDEGIRRVRQDRFNADNQIIFHLIMEYDDLGRRVRQAWYDPNDRLMRTYHLNYDKMGNRVGVMSIRGDGKLEWRIAARFDERGNQTASRMYGRITRLSWTRIRYMESDPNENWTRAVQLQWQLMSRLGPRVSRLRLERVLDYF